MTAVRPRGSWSGERGGAVRVRGVGVIGLDSAGSSLARRLIDEGFEVTVHDSDARIVANLAEAGAGPARIPADAAERADVVLVHVADEAAAEEALFDCGGVGETLRDGGCVVVASAAGPAFVHSAAARLRMLGLSLVEAWFVADDGGAASTVVVGGGPADLETVGPVLRAVTGDVLHLGPLGSVAALRTAVTALHPVPPLVREHERSTATLAGVVAAALGVDTCRAAAGRRPVGQQQAAEDPW
jgi:3-hydroxyisobutyrate dehydrogenase-like beta-hydroxyacid dehydrogenase